MNPRSEYDSHLAQHPFITDTPKKYIYWLEREIYDCERALHWDTGAYEFETKRRNDLTAELERVKLELEEGKCEQQEKLSPL